MNTPTPVPTLPDYPTADLARPGRYPHRILVGRELVIAHVRDDGAQPRTLEQLADDQGWADLAPRTRRRYAAEARARIAAWARDEWQYIGVVVTVVQTWGGHVPREIGHAAVWGIESDGGAAYLATTARELFDEAEHDVIALLAAITAGDPRQYLTGK